MNLVSFIQKYSDHHVPGKFAKDISVFDVIDAYKQNGLDSTLIDMYLCKSLLKKHPFDADIVDATLNDFKQSEDRAYRYDLSFSTIISSHDQLRTAMEVWRSHVHVIMGKFKAKYLERLSITTGATSTCPTGNDIISRFSACECTQDAYAYIEENDLHHLMLSTPSIGHAVMNIVPKTAKIGRIVFSPCAVNAQFQRALGLSLKDKLGHQGILLDDAQDVHRRLVVHGSTGVFDITTDDMKWASALIYTNLVKYLVPPDWYDVLSAFTDKQVIDNNGDIIPIRQFATMGNGFCFELETIIFLGLLRTAASINKIDTRHRHIRVFGDDLIYPSVLTKHVRTLGASIGFITNVDKSFSEGPFRESCGVDCLDGINIRPVYLKGDFSQPYDLTIMANNVRALYNRMLEQGVPCPNLRKIANRITAAIYRMGKNNVLWTPDNLEGLHGRPYENLRLSVSKWGVVTCKSWKKIPLKTQTFRTLSYKKDADFVLRCVSTGFMKGHGLTWYPQERLRKHVFGPPKPAHQAYPRSIVCPGSSYVARVVDAHVFEYPPLVRTQNPLDIFDVLHQTNCSRRIYTTRYNAYKAFLYSEELLQFVSTIVVLLYIRDQTIRSYGLVDSVNFTLD